MHNGNRIVKILLIQDIPCFGEVEGCNCRIWYPRQPAQCSICREFGHRAPACPLSGCCRQPGHVARECTQAWGSPSPVLTTLVPPDHAMETEDATSSSSAVPDPLPDPVITTAHVSIAITALTPSSFSSPVTATSASASESDFPTSVSPAPVPTTSSAPTFGLSTSVSTASSTPVCTPSLSTSASSKTSPASASSKKDDPGPTVYPEYVTDQTTARAYLKKVMTKQISACDAKLFENWSRTNTNHFSDWTIESYSVPSQYKNIVMELAKHLGYEYKKKYFGT